MRVRGTPHHVFADLDEGMVLDAADLEQQHTAADFVVDFEHHGRDQLVALRDQGSVSLDFVRQLGVATLFDMQHLLDLMPDRLIILEKESRDRTHLDAAIFLQRRNRLAGLAPTFRIFARRDQIGGREAALRG